MSGLSLAARGGDMHEGSVLICSPRVATHFANCCILNGGVCYL